MNFTLIKRRKFAVLLLIPLAVIAWRITLNSRRARTGGVRAPIVAVAAKRSAESRLGAMAKASDPNPPEKMNGPVNPRKAALANLWKDPAWMASRYDEVYLGVETKYGRFIGKHGNWDPDKVKKFKEILATENLEIYRDAMVDDTSQVAAEISKVQSRYDSELTDLIGPTDYQDLQQSQQTDAYRPEVSRIVDAMRSNTCDISDDTEEKLAGLYAEAVADAASAAQGTDISSMGPDELAALKQSQRDSFHARLLERLSGTLTDTQTQEFMAAVTAREN